MKATLIKNQEIAYWHKQIELANQHPDGILKYCEANGIASPTYYRWKLKLNRITKKALPKLRPASSFAEVRVCNPEVVRNHGLPEAKWLAEFVLHLSKGAQ